VETYVFPGYLTYIWPASNYRMAYR